MSMPRAKGIERESVVRFYVEHQESEEEQESFTDVGRKRAAKVLGEMYDRLKARRTR
jgi:hypothetical protein